MSPRAYGDSPPFKKTLRAIEFGNMLVGECSSCSQIRSCSPDFEIMNGNEKWWARVTGNDAMGISCPALNHQTLFRTSSPLGETTHKWDSQVGNWININAGIPLSDSSILRRCGINTD